MWKFLGNFQLNIFLFIKLIAVWADGNEMFAHCIQCSDIVNCEYNEELAIKLKSYSQWIQPKCRVLNETTTTLRFCYTVQCSGHWKTNDRTKVTRRRRRTEDVKLSGKKRWNSNSRNEKTGNLRNNLCADTIGNAFYFCFAFPLSSSEKMSHWICVRTWASFNFIVNAVEQKKGQKMPHKLSLGNI